LRSKSWQRKVSALGRAALVQAANDRAHAYRMYIEWALKQPGRQGRLISFRGAAIRLNERNIETPLGGTWRGHHIQRMARRLGIDHPFAYLSGKSARDRVRALWDLHPNLTAPAVIASMGTPQPLSLKRAYALLHDCRRDAAGHSRVHSKVGWSLDHRTATRIRIGELWKRQPDLTGMEVIQKLKLGPEAPLKWVQRIMNECWQAHAKPNSAQRRKGRKFHDPWRSHLRRRNSGSVTAQRAAR